MRFCFLCPENGDFPVKYDRNNPNQSRNLSKGAQIMIKKDEIRTPWVLCNGLKMEMRREDREVTTIKEIEKIILQCKTCHVAMVNEKIPYVVPLSYGYKILDGNMLELYFHSALEGKKIDILRKSNKVCFEMSYEGEAVYTDNPCNSGYYFASVIGFGDAVFIDDADKKCEALSIMFKHQSGKEVVFTASQVENICVFKIISTDFMGKRKPKSNI